MEKTLEATRLLGLCRGLDSTYIPSFRTYDRKVMGIRSGINMVIVVVKIMVPFGYPR